MSLYQLTINERQAGLIAEALDAWSRIRAGQMWALERVIYADTPERMEAIQRQVKYLEMVVNPSGVSDHNRPGCRLAFNLRKVLEHGASWDRNPEGGMTVNYDGPLDGWWEGEPPALMLKFEGDEAVRIRDRADKQTRLGAELAELLETEDIQEATRIVRDLIQHKFECEMWS